VLANNAEIVAITVDSIMNTTAWERVIGPFDFPLCSDFWPHGEVSGRYGVLQKSGGKSDDGTGSSGRAVVIVDRSGTVAFRKTYARDEVAPVEEVLTLLEQI
jgi:alkyl hydroperoxide reductase subunit AhpC